MDTIGKRILHAFFGIIPGIALGYAVCVRLARDIDHLHWYMIVGAVFGAAGAFYATDEFWERFRN